MHTAVLALLLALTPPWVSDGTVSLFDCDRLPQDWEMSDQIVILLRRDAENQYSDLYQSTERIWQCWDDASWAVYHRQRGEYADCLARLRSLRALLGPEDYAAGRLPGPVPVPREVIPRRPVTSFVGGIP